MRISQTAGSKPCRVAFTLIEVAVAMAVMGLVMAGMFEGYVLASRRAQYASISLAANAAAMAQLEQIVAASWVVTGTSCTNIFNPALTNLYSNGVVNLGYSGVPISGTSVYGTNQVTIQQVSVNPPYVWVQVSCCWNFTGMGNFTNTVGLLRAPNL